MRLSRSGAGVLAAVLALGACDSEIQGPTTTTPAGVDLGFTSQAYGSHSAGGAVAADGSVLTSDFAVAAHDSVGGLVVLSYDRENRGLFILQTSTRAPGTYTCAGVETGGSACHARYLHNARVENGMVKVDAQLELATGTLVLEQVGPDVLRGTLEARLDPVWGEAVDTLFITGGVLDLRYIPENLQDARLHCLVALTGAGSGGCGA